MGAGLTLPPLYFHNGGVKAFLNKLKQHALLVRSVEDPNTYLVNDVADPLQRSMTVLDLQQVHDRAAWKETRPGGGAGGGAGGAAGGGARGAGSTAYAQDNATSLHTVFEQVAFFPRWSEADSLLTANNPAFQQFVRSARKRN